MKINKIFLASIFILALITLGAVSATDELTADNGDSLSTADEIDLQAASDDAAVSGDESIYIYDIDGSTFIVDDNVCVEIYGNYEENLTRKDFNLTVDDLDHDFTYDSENDRMVFNVSDLSIGNHTFLIKFLGTKKYNPVSSSGSFDIVEYELYSPNYVYCGSFSSGTVYIETPSSRIGEIFTVSIGDETVSKKIEGDDGSRGSAVIDLRDFNASGGEHNMTLKLNDTVIENKTIHFDYDILVGERYMDYGDEEFLLGDIRGIDESDMYVLINGTSYSIQFSEVQGSRLLYVTGVDDLRPGMYDIELWYTGARFTQKVFNGTLEVGPVIYIPYYVVGNPETDVFRLLLPQDAKGNLLIYVKKASEEWPTTPEGMNKLLYANATLGGETVIPIENLPYGYYNYDYRTVGYDGYKISSDHDYFTVNPNITFPTEQIMIGENATIAVDLAGENGTLAVGDKYGSEYISEVSLVNGKATIQVSNLTAGVHHLFVHLRLEKYDDEGFAIESTLYEWYVDVSVKPNITLPSGKVNVGDKQYVSVDLPGYNGTLIVTEAKKEGEGGEAKLVDGKASVLIPKLDRAGNLTYAVGLSLEYYDDYGNVESDVYIYNGTLEVVYPYTIIPNALFTRYDSGNAFTVTVVDADNNTVKNFTLMLKVYTGQTSKKYFITTNDEGVASFDLASTLDIGVHDVVVVSTNQNYTVKKAYSTIQVAKAKTIVNAPAVTVKFKKSDYFKVKIKNKATRKPVAKVKIKLRIFTGNKYQTFTVKTSKYGNAVFDTKDLSIGKHKVVIYTIDGRYKIGAKSVIYVKK